MEGSSPFARLHGSRARATRRRSQSGPLPTFGWPPSDATDWRAVAALHNEDEVEAALERAQEIGLGIAARNLAFYRLIEAEATTRSRASFLSIKDDLELEYLAEEVPPELAAHAAKVIRGAAERVARRLGFGGVAPTLVTILAAETDAPWTPGRDGMCLLKGPYQKVCLPHRLVSDPDLLHRVTSHEFAHVVTNQVAPGRLPTWLGEAIAMAMEGMRRPSMATGPWLGLKELEAAFRSDRRDPQGLSQVARAYAQSADIGRTLHELGGDDGLARLLAVLASPRLWDQLMAVLGAAGPVDAALKRAYNLDENALFDRART